MNIYLRLLFTRNAIHANLLAGFVFHSKYSQTARWINGISHNTVGGVVFCVYRVISSHSILVGSEAS